MDEAEETGSAPEQAVHASHSEPGRTRKRAPDAAFDQWLHLGLRTMHDDLLQEPIPVELLRLIQRVDE